MNDAAALVARYTGLARALAWNAIRRGTDRDEARAGAMRGLARAAAMYEPGRAAFATFATLHIRRELVALYRDEHGRHGERRLDLMTLDDADRLELLPDGRPGPVELLEAGERATIVRAALARLRPRDREVVTRYFGIGRPEQLLREISADLGMTKQGASQRIHGALRRLRCDRRLAAA